MIRKVLIVFLLVLVLCLGLSGATADTFLLDHGNVTVAGNQGKPGEQYSLIVVSGADIDRMADDSKVLYVNQLQADQNGCFSVTFLYTDLPPCSFWAGGSFADGGESPRLLGKYNLESQAFTLPGALIRIEEEAFAGCTFRHVILGDRVQSVGPGAFRNCAELRFIEIPDTVTEIADDAFAGCEQLTVICHRDTKAFQYAQDHGLAVQIAD